MLTTDKAWCGRAGRGNGRHRHRSSPATSLVLRRGSPPSAPTPAAVSTVCHHCRGRRPRRPDPAFGLQHPQSTSPMSPARSHVKRMTTRGTVESVETRPWSGVLFDEFAVAVPNF
jgi:hypothetical protein